MGGREEGKGGLPLRGQQFLLSFKELLSCECCQETAVKMRLCECVNVLLCVQEMCLCDR